MRAGIDFSIGVCSSIYHGQTKMSRATILKSNFWRNTSNPMYNYHEYLKLVERAAFRRLHCIRELERYGHVWSNSLNLFEMMVGILCYKSSAPCKHEQDVLQEYHSLPFVSKRHCETPMQMHIYHPQNVDLHTHGKYATRHNHKTSLSACRNIIKFPLRISL
jgi:hypothetical protein